MWLVGTIMSDGFWKRKGVSVGGLCSWPYVFCIYILIYFERCYNEEALGTTVWGGGRASGFHQRALGFVNIFNQLFGLKTQKLGSKAQCTVGVQHPQCIPGLLWR